ncbi:hypothetical protein BHE74_00041857 [Ensete ventricosum]|nr:hypothetical protein BHE74_00041857 [Ensete ventricosum]
MARTQPRANPQGRPTALARGDSCPQGQQPVGAAPAGRSAARGHSFLQRDTCKGGPATGCPQWAGAGCRGGRPLAGQLLVGKGNRRLRRGNSGGGGAEGARGVRVSFLEKDNPTPTNSRNSEDSHLELQNTLNNFKNSDDYPLI